MPNPDALDAEAFEKLDRERRRYIHLVLPATNETMKNLDNEIYFGNTNSAPDEED